MKISVTPGDVQVASVEVRRHSGGIYTIQIVTPEQRHGGGIHFGSEMSDKTYLSQRVLLYDYSQGRSHIPTTITFTPESDGEEEALYMGLFDVLDNWSRYSVTLIAIPTAVLVETEEAGKWEPQRPIDYLAT